MERPSNHFTESSARCPLRPKEMKLDFGGATNDERFSESTAKSDERRGFRPAPKLLAPHLSRGKQQRAGAVTAVDGNNSNGETFGAIVPQNIPMTDTPMKSNPLQVGHLQRTAQTRGLEFSLTSSTQPRLKAKAHAAGRQSRGSDTMLALHSNTLWVEGNSVLNTEIGVASSALNYLSECVARERQRKEEWEAARFAKVQAFRAVVKVFMMSFTDAGGSGNSGDPRQSNSKGITDTLSIARCSVVTNALVGTIQSFARAFRSRQLAAARGTLPLAAPPYRPTTSSTDFAHSFNSAAAASRFSTANTVSSSQSFSTNDALDREEISQLKQLYFDFFDCEAVSIRTATPSGNDGSMCEVGSALNASRPFSASFMEDVDDFAQCASRTM
ncbi:hypothetical protein ABL78_7815 [Leptomonas seymouri]|uniref:Uncharacterized protein n=1 Tax=Leptomonas seymouri TaxID=5684 RepID=A0A0N1I004_LEPSE|nr:hypothetical protein ABL78_7815 [Leptomonas seymouri]|eukprot:KPI83160.1 hypothetical protein ABL78_7815 [Leptomonas seymouri]